MILKRCTCRGEVDPLKCRRRHRAPSAAFPRAGASWGAGGGAVGALTAFRSRGRVQRSSDGDLPWCLFAVTASTAEGVQGQLCTIGITHKNALPPAVQGIPRRRQPRSSRWLTR